MFAAERQVVYLPYGNPRNLLRAFWGTPDGKSDVAPCGRSDVMCSASCAAGTHHSRSVHHLAQPYITFRESGTHRFPVASAKKEKALGEGECAKRNNQRRSRWM